MVGKQKRRRRKRIKNAVFRFMAYLNGTLFIISACAIDSESQLPFIVCCVTLAYLFIFAKANNWFEEEVDDYGTDDLDEEWQTGVGDKSSRF